MKRSPNAGFSLVELLLVVTIVGIIASIAIPYYYRARQAAEGAATIAHLSVIRSTQATHYSQKVRYGRMDEIASIHGSLGTTSGTTIVQRGNFRYELDPTTVTDAQLKSNYRIVATKVSDNSIPYVYVLTQNGQICQTDPVVRCVGN
jgi:prepilin-type N-terminal cleavage/methylation domain-containing protein